MKVTAISKDGRFYKIGEALADAVWYGIGDEVKSYITSIQKGDEVEIKFSTGADKKRVLNYIKKTGSAPTQTNGEAPSTFKKPWVDYGTKSPEVQDSIRKQAVGHMTSRTLIAMQGSIDSSNVIEMIDMLYAKYLDLTK